MSTQLVNICPPPPISPQDFYDALVGPEEKGVRQPLSGRGTLPFHPQVTFSWAALRLVGPLQSAAAPVSLVPEGPWFRPTPNPWRLKSVTVSLLCARFCTPAVNQPTTTLVVSLFFFQVMSMAYRGSLARGGIKSCSRWPRPRPRQIRATSATYTTLHATPDP